MPRYRIFILNEKGHVAGPSVFFTCETDGEAFDKAQQVAEGSDFEIWDDMRIIVRGGRPLT